MRSRIVTVNDKMQQGYRYVVVAPVGRAFDPQFQPDLTPSRCSLLRDKRFTALFYAVFRS